MCLLSLQVQKVQPRFKPESYCFNAPLGPGLISMISYLGYASVILMSFKKCCLVGGKGGEGVSVAQIH